MNINTISNKSKTIKDTSVLLLKQYQDILAKLLAAYEILATTNHQSLTEIKEFIDGMDSKIKAISKEYTYFFDNIQTYVASSDNNYEKLEKDIYTISRDLMDAISSLK